MRSLWLCGLLVLLAGAPAQSEDADRGAETARLNLARAAMDAQIRLGDLARARGDLPAAEKAYRAALAIYERTSRRALRPDVSVEGTPRRPRLVLVNPKGRIVGRRPNSIGAITPQTRRSALKTRQSIDAGLTWLAKNQDKSGFWDADQHGGGALFNIGVTGLATMAFLGAGYGKKGVHKYAANVTNGLKALVRAQEKDGCIGPRSSQSFIYNHCIATTALCETLFITKDPRYRAAAKKAVEFIESARNQYLAWRYMPRGGENDTSVSAWAIIALTSARSAGLAVDDANFVGARTWVEKMTDQKTGRVGYNYPGGGAARPEGMQDRFPGERTEAMTAAGLMIRAFSGSFNPKSHVVIQGANRCNVLAPAWNTENGSIDMYYWYFGTLAMFQIGGAHWRDWSHRLAAAAGTGQRDDGVYAGSWDPAGPWGNDGGRVYATAVMTMSLEVVNRFDRVFSGPRANAPKAD